MEWKEYLADTNGNLATFRTEHSGAVKGFLELYQGTMQDGALSAKGKELMSLSIGIHSRCTDCVAYHTRTALRAGATREEVVEAIGVAVMMGGGPVYMYAAHAMEVLEEFSA